MNKILQTFIMIELIEAFPPIVPDKPHTLILGTMPGGKSLAANQYYAHPQNQFWKLMGDIFGASLLLPYDQRVQILKDKGIAVWDVVRACTRKGSMDSDIKNEIPNNFEEFYNQYPSIKLVIFDSLTAEKIYNKRTLPNLTKKLEYKRVPSPSPANARISYASKLILWSEALKAGNH